LFWLCQVDFFAKLSSFSMYQITIRLPCNRDYAGTLKLEDAKGKLIAGPFHICARAHDELAQANGNPDRIPVLPFGDMPLGEYQITQIIPSGPGTPYDSDEFGSAGIVFLQPRHGEAVLADANGRFIFLIQGGALSRNGALRPTDDGSLRLSNRDQRKLVGILRRVGAGACRCIVTNSGNAKRRVATAGSARSPRAPGRGAAAAGLAETSRRSWLRTMLIAAGAFASVPSLLLFSAPKAHGEGGGTDYSPKEDLNKYQDQLKQAQDAAAQAQADYERETQTNPNANMAPMLDAQGKVQGLENMVRYEQEQAAKQQSGTVTQPNNENSSNNTTTGTESNTGNESNTTTGTESNTGNSSNTTGMGTESNTGNESNATTTGTESNTGNSSNTTGTGTESNTGNESNTTTTGTESNTGSSSSTTGTGTESNAGNESNTTTGTESNTGNSSNTTGTGTESTTENPPVKEPTYNTGPDTHDQSNSALVGANDVLHDAPHDTQSNQNQAGATKSAMSDLNNGVSSGQNATGEKVGTEINSTGTTSGAFGARETDSKKINSNGNGEGAAGDLSKFWDQGMKGTGTGPAVFVPPATSSGTVTRQNTPPATTQTTPATTTLSPTEQAIKNYNASGPAYTIPPKYIKTAKEPPTPDVTPPKKAKMTPPAL
jgi:hypothetical protein